MGCSERCKEIKRRRHRRKKLEHFKKRLDKATVSEKVGDRQQDPGPDSRCRRDHPEPCDRGTLTHPLVRGTWAEDRNCPPVDSVRRTSRVRSPEKRADLSISRVAKAPSRPDDARADQDCACPPFCTGCTGRGPLPRTAVEVFQFLIGDCLQAGGQRVRLYRPYSIDYLCQTVRLLAAFGCLI